jgi:hypothetical protein
MAFFFQVACNLELLLGTWNGFFPSKNRLGITQKKIHNSRNLKVKNLKFWENIKQTFFYLSDFFRNFSTIFSTTYHLLNKSGPFYIINLDPTSFAIFFKLK